MNCKRTREMLADYVNGILDPEDSSMIQEHVAECDSCRRELEMLEKVLSLIDDVKVEYPPASIWDKFLPDLHRRIESEAALVFRKQQRQRLYLLPGWLASITVVLLILLASIMIRYYPPARPVQLQTVENPEPEIVQVDSSSEDSSEQMLVAGIISKVLISEAEAAELKKLKNFIQSETLVLQYQHDDILVDTGWEAASTEDDEGVIQFLLENEFAEFDDSTVVETDIGGLAKM